VLTPVRFLHGSIWLVFAWISWVVAIGGVSAAQDRCTPGDGRTGVHTLAYLSGGPQISCAFFCTCMLPVVVTPFRSFGLGPSTPLPTSSAAPRSRARLSLK